VLHKHVETNVLREVVAIRNLFVLSVHSARIDSGLDLSFICLVGVGNEEARVREPLLHDVLGILNGSLQQLLEVLKVRISLVVSLLPLVDGLSLPNANVEEGVQQKDHVVLHTVDVQQHWSSCFRLQVVAHHGWLDHNQRVSHVLSHNSAGVVLSLIG